jgi:hypothetical protein
MPSLSCRNFCLVTLVLLQSLAPASRAEDIPVSENCQLALTATKKMKSKEDADLRQAWEESRASLPILTAQIIGVEPQIHSVATALLAGRHAWLGGDPGGAKTLLATTMFEAEVRGLGLPPEKLTFVLQCHKLLNEGTLTGYAKLNDVLERGQYTIETKNSLMDGFVYTLLDEVEKLNPATATAMLSILNERKAFLGSRVVDAFLRTALMTSNKTIEEFKASFGREEAPTADALIDRVGTRQYVFNHLAASIQSNKLLHEKRIGKRPDLHENAVHRKRLFATIRVGIDKSSDESVSENLLHLGRKDKVYFSALPKPFFGNRITPHGITAHDECDMRGIGQ